MEFRTKIVHEVKLKTKVEADVVSFLELELQDEWGNPNLIPINDVWVELDSLVEGFKQPENIRFAKILLSALDIRMAKEPESYVLFIFSDK
jgi:hypothetical protein